MDLRLEVLKLKAMKRKSYKIIAEESGINYSTLVKFTSGERSLTDENKNKLITYLSNYS